MSKKSWLELGNQYRIQKSVEIFNLLETVSRKLQPYQNNDLRSDRNGFRNMQSVLL